MRPHKAVRPASLIAALVALAALGGAAQARPAATETLNPAALPADLPAQGLVFQKPHAVVLETLQGKPIGTLPGFSLYAPENLSDKQFVRSVGIGGLTDADPALVILYDKAGNGWVLDAPAHRLRQLGRIEVALAGGAELVVVPKGSSSGASATTSIVQHGKTILRGEVSVTGGRYVWTSDVDGKKKGVLIDLETGHRWRIAPHCAVAGIVAGRAIAGCTPVDTIHQPTQLLSFASNGSSRLLARYTHGLYAEQAALSPDAQWALVDLAPGCGPGWAAVASVTTGTTQLLIGGGKVPSTGPMTATRFSSGLGWTADNTIVADIAGVKPSSCDHESESGTFLIDPATLAKTRASSSFAAQMWGS